MSNSIYPVLAGVGWDIEKTPEFSTKIQQAYSGVEYRGALRDKPLYFCELKYDYLSASDFKSLTGFFLQMKGSFDSFLFTDQTDYSVTDQSIGVGNGSTTNFQLIRTMGGFNEDIENVNTITNVKVDGVSVSHTVGSTGIITIAAPASGKSVTWTGTFYYRCRFKDDVSSFTNFMQNLYSAKKVSLYGSPENKV